MHMNKSQYWKCNKKQVQKVHFIIKITIYLLLNLLPIHDSFHEIINSEFYLGVILLTFFNQVKDEENYKTFM